MTARDESTLFLDEAIALIKLFLHSLLHNLVIRNQILRDGRNMQDIFNVSLVPFFAEWDIADVSNRMCSVVSSFDIAGSIQLPLVSEPLFMGCHMVRSTGVGEPYVFRTRGTS